MRKATYKQAGVDIDAGERAVDMMKDAVRSTHGPAVLKGLADFGGMTSLGGEFSDPDTIGHDCVAMCVDDIVCQGATPLLFLDYIGTGTMVPETIEQIVRGVAEACRLCGAALLGGESAELPGFYADGEYDLVGFAVGVVERENVIDGSKVAAGDVLIGLPSSGLHSNGYSLARYVLLDDPAIPLEQHMPELGRTLGEELLEPTRVYAGALAKLFAAAAGGEAPLPHALAHITGGGIEGIECPAIFDLIQRLGDIEEVEMRRTFNLGLGMALAVAPEGCDATIAILTDAGEQPTVIGQITAGGDGEAIMQ